MNASSSLMMLSVCLFLAVTVMGGTVLLCAAEVDSVDTPCIILTRPTELYNLGLESRSGDEEHTVTIGFNHSLPVIERLTVEAPFRGSLPGEDANVYHITLNSTVLCIVEYKGVESVLPGEEHARLEVTSTDYYVRLEGVQSEESQKDLAIPESFRLVLALCSLVPFILLIPDVVEDLQIHLDNDASTRGVYGRIISILLPLLSIALTILLLDGLDLYW